MASYERQWGKGHVVLLMNSVRLLTVSISSSKGQMRGGSLTLGKGHTEPWSRDSLPPETAGTGRRRCSPVCSGSSRHSALGCPSPRATG